MRVLREPKTLTFCPSNLLSDVATGLKPRVLHQFKSSLQKHGLSLCCISLCFLSLSVLCVNLQGYLIGLSEKVPLNKPGIVERHKHIQGVTLVATFLACDKYFSPK